MQDRVGDGPTVSGRNSVITLPYRNDFAEAHLPSKNILSILKPKDAKAVEDKQAEVRRALEHPIGCDRISKIVQPEDEVVIIADDNTRPTPTDIIVPILLNKLNEGGVEDSKIKVIAALGTHRCMTYEELKRKFGSLVLKRVEVRNHDYLAAEGLVDLGCTKNKTPIQVNKEVIDADVKIAVGNIVPHHLCGWAGGAKIIQPGVSGEETTAATHLLGARSPITLLGKANNVVRNEMEAIGRRVNVDMIVNTVLDRNGSLVKVFAGDIVQAAKMGIETSKKVYFAETPAKTDIVLASSYPCDIDFWQAHKALYSSALAVKENGTIIVVAACPEGVSGMHPELLDIGRLPPSDILAGLERGEIEDPVGASLAIACSMVKRCAKVILVSKGISATEAERLGFDCADTVDQALSKAFAEHGLGAKVTILPNAPDTVPIIRS